MPISFVSEEVRRPNIRFRIISKILKQIVINNCRVPGNITYIFCSDEYLRNINVKYLAHDYYTDIITFDYCDERVISGDMFISVERVKENSILYMVNINDEFLRVIIHGLLHLLGFTDSNDRERKIMKNAENEFIDMFKNKNNEYII